jgi:hypothetical protein
VVANVTAVAVLVAVGPAVGCAEGPKVGEARSGGPVATTAAPAAGTLAACLEAGAALAALRLAPVGGPEAVAEVAGSVEDLTPDLPVEVRGALHDLAAALVADGADALVGPDGPYGRAEAAVLAHLRSTCGTD